MDRSDHNILHLLNQQVRRLNQRMNEKLKEYDLYMSQWAVIYTLHTMGPMTQKEIWQYLNVEAPTVTRTITRLEEKGWLVRKQGADKRQRIIHISPEAEQRRDEIAASIRKYEDEQLLGLTEEEEKQLRGLLERMIIQEDDHDGED
ncbi:MarR family transcriptional regulator [Halobacillus halophilus]|uniref:MarR family winged helix-turn-helix transcriptional regulator n=1 Tax=Halobacillus halophilus TaxID=1570 RepID=UPI00136A3BBB|nr:MarR family transcriptional regulator [Halobacillus halophilus]MYL30905.1 MarR family transcriptional regulator [Halobacillus halophilus]